MRKKNVGMVERVIRVAMGSAFAIGGLTLLIGGDGLIWLLLDIALIVLGVDFIVTGIRGYCPLYNWLGWSTAIKPQHG